MGPAFRVDAMTVADVPAVTAIDGPTRMDEEQLRAEMGRTWSRRWGVREDGEPVGYLLSWHVVDELHVMNVATRLDRRRRGIGRALMNTVVAYARSYQVKHVLLEVRRSNHPAIALYRSVGFFAMGVRSRYYADDEDAVEMVLALDPATGEIMLRPDEIRLEA